MAILECLSVGIKYARAFRNIPGIARCVAKSALVVTEWCWYAGLVGDQKTVVSLVEIKTEEIARCVEEVPDIRFSSCCTIADCEVVRERVVAQPVRYRKLNRVYTGNIERVGEVCCIAHYHTIGMKLPHFHCRHN